MTPMPAASRPQIQVPAEASMKGIMISSVPTASIPIPTGSRSTPPRRAAPMASARSACSVPLPRYQAEAGRYRRAAQIPARVRGTLMRKEARQPQSSPSQPMNPPLSTGPSATETPMTAPKSPKARPRASPE